MPVANVKINDMQKILHPKNDYLFKLNIEP